MHFSIETYAEQLHNLNLSKLVPVTNDPTKTLALFNELAWGLVEELEEYLDPLNTRAELLNEYGDVFAYGVLLVELYFVKCNLDWFYFTLQEDIDCYSLKLPAGTTDRNCFISGKLLFQNFKRVNRDAAVPNFNLIYLLLLNVSKHASTVHGITLSDALNVNLIKLNRRAKNDTLFSGSGGSR